MGKVIELRKGKNGSTANLITSRPIEFRYSHWKSAHFVQLYRPYSIEVEKEGGSEELPPHFVLKGGLASTIKGLFQHRDHEGRMKQVYLVTGIMDCMINQVNPVLRTDLLHHMFKKFFEMKQELQLHWYPPLDQVLLPIDSHLFNESHYRSALATAPTLKEIYNVIKEGTEEMFQVISKNYVFYCPRGRS